MLLLVEVLKFVGRLPSQLDGRSVLLKHISLDG